MSGSFAESDLQLKASYGSPPCCELTLERHPVGRHSDPWDTFSYRSLSAKEPLIIGLFMGRHPVAS